MPLSDAITTTIRKTAIPVGSGLAAHQTRITDLLVSDRDAPLWLLKVAAGTCDRYVGEVLARLDAIAAAVTDVDTTPVREPTGALLQTAERHVLAASTETSAGSRQRRADLAAGSLRSYAVALSPSAALSSEEAAAEVQTALLDLAGYVAAVDRTQAALDLLLDALPACGAGADASRLATTTKAIQDLRSGAQQGRRGRTLLALGASLALRRGAAAGFVSTPKWEGTVTPTGTVVRAKRVGTLSAPFDIKTGTVVPLVVDGTAVNWTPPVGAPAVLRTGALPASLTFASGVDDTWILVIGTTTVTKVFGTATLSLAAVAALLDTQLGVLGDAVVDGSVIKITTAATGQSAKVVVGAGSANSLFMVVSGDTARGAGVTILALQESATTAGVALAVQGQFVRRASFTAAVSGTTITLPSAPWAADAVAGDAVALDHADSRVWYHITAVGSGSATLDRSVTVGSYTALWVSDLLVLSSQLPSAGSEVSLLAGVASLGLARGGSRSGAVQCTATALPTSPAVHPGDVLVVAGVENRVDRVGTASLLLRDPLVGASAAAVYPLGVLRLAALESGLAAWREAASAAKHRTVPTMQLGLVLDAVAGRGGKARALAQVADVRATYASLRAVLRAYDAVQRPMLSSLLAMLRSDKYDLAADTLSEGRLLDFLAITEDTATYGGDLSAGLVGLGSAIPVSGADLGAYEPRPSLASGFADDDEDDGNDDYITVGEDDGDLVF